MTTPCKSNHENARYGWAYSEWLACTSPMQCMLQFANEHYRCKHCGCDSVRTGKTVRFCSEECKAAHDKLNQKRWAANRKVKPSARTCQSCGTRFTSVRPAKFCSGKCRVKSHRARPPESS